MKTLPMPNTKVTDAKTAGVKPVDAKAIIIDFIGRQRNQRFELAYLEKHLVSGLGRTLYDQQGGYRRLVSELMALVAAEYIRPVKARGTNGLNPPLYRWYQRCRKGPADSQWQRQLLAVHHPALNTRFYQDKPEEYGRDRSYIEAIDAFFRRIAGESAPASVNERSYALFRDEKLLASSRGHQLLQRLGLTYDSLNCYPTYEPFFYYSLGVRAENNTLVIENKDTFFTLKKLFVAGRPMLRPAGEIGSLKHQAATINFNLLIYGEGKKIESSLAYFTELPEYRRCTNRFYYFGDLDPEGIFIFERLVDNYPDFDLYPCLPLYTALIGREGQQAPRQRSAARTTGHDNPYTERFLNRFDAAAADRLAQVLGQERYIPQEALDYSYLATVFTDDGVEDRTG